MGILDGAAIRWSTADDASGLAALSGLGGVWAWESAANHWLVVEASGRLIGAVQVEPGMPFGHLGFLSISRALEHRDRHSVGAALIAAGLEALRLVRVPGAIIVAPLGEKWIKRLVKTQFGGRVADTGNVMVIGNA